MRKNAEAILKENPQRVPVIVETTDKSLPLTKREFLAAKRLQIMHFTATLWKSMKLNPENSIYLYTNGKVIRPDRYIGEVYDENRSEEDLYLHLKVTDIQTLGGDSFIANCFN